MGGDFLGDLKAELLGQVRDTKPGSDRRESIVRQLVAIEETIATRERLKAAALAASADPGRDVTDLSDDQFIAALNE